MCDHGQHCSKHAVVSQLGAEQALLKRPSLCVQLGHVAEFAMRSYTRLCMTNAS